MRESSPCGDEGVDLAGATDVLLDHSAPEHAQKLACEAIYRTCLSRIPPLSSAATCLPDGNALAPADAARCLLDGVRTARLLQAIDAAIDRRARQAPGRQIQLLYAGCGPIAPLALLLAPRHRHHAVRFTLVDVHPEALHCARRLFELAGVSSLLGDCLCADASRLRLAAETAPDILLVEMLQRALARESQVAVVANLLPQCASDAVLVPRSITVSAWLARAAPECQASDSASRIALGTLLELSASSLPSLQQNLRDDPEALPELLLQLPDPLPTGLALMLRTQIETGPELLLTDGDSGLTYPQYFWNIAPLLPGAWLGFSYHLGPDPGFRVRVVGDATAPEHTAPGCRTL